MLLNHENSIFMCENWRDGEKRPHPVSEATLGMTILPCILSGPRELPFVSSGLTTQNAHFFVDLDAFNGTSAMPP